MKKEISRPWVSDYFAIALQHFFAAKVMTQKELATRVGITPATMSDYTNMKRGKGASEDMRRVLCRRLTRREGKVWVYNDQPNIYPPYFAGETNMRVLGPVIWIGRDLSN